MSAIRGDWLVHGCMNVGGLPKDRRPALEMRDRIGEMYDGVHFKLRMWPQRGFKEILWWSEKNVPHRYGAAYFLRLDPSRGPVLYAGITVEKGFEDRDVAARRAKELNEPVDQLLLGKSWDWHRALASLPATGTALHDASRVLGKELYCWVEFGNDGRYFVVKPDALYVRGGFRPVPWDKVGEFASQSQRRKWGRSAVVRAFGLNECSPELDASAVLEVFRAMKNVRDVWRGLVPVPPTGTDIGGGLTRG